MQIEHSPDAAPSVWRRFTSTTFYSMTKYLLARAVMIGITIVVGVFFATLIINKSQQIDNNIHSKIGLRARRESLQYTFGSPKQKQVYERVSQELAEEQGLNLPFWPRHLRWTYNALTFNWGQTLFTSWNSVFGQAQKIGSIKELVLDRLKYTLLLIGSAYLLIFVIGIPLALSLSRKHGKWQDRLFSFLAPLSSIPSWVHGTLLMLILAMELRLLPFGGMFDIFPPETKWGYIPIVFKHMILPVSAIVISLLFQLIYTWRTFFLIYANEDYVELAKAQGLPSKTIERKHVLRPAFPYVITSFALTLVSFWQTTTALEYILRWPGIGHLYISSLPHFWDEYMFPGELLVALALVVLFAYLLGITVLVLDVIYALVDPRVRIGASGPTTTSPASQARLVSIIGRRQARSWQIGIFISLPRYSLKSVSFSRPGVDWSDLWLRIRAWTSRLRSVLQELISYPSAAAGLAIITVLVGGSLYAVLFLPYAEIGRDWISGETRARQETPKLALPTWTNWFRKDDLLSKLVLNSQHDTVSKTIQPASNDMTSVVTTFTFDYPYAEIPQDLLINFVPQYDVKRPFATLVWVTPDGRELVLRSLSVESETQVNIADYIPRKLILFYGLDDKNLYEDSQGPNRLYALFADPDAETLTHLKGQYQLRVEGLLFEDEGDLDSELVMLGQVHGLAGTDNLRRDLLVPLLWGMPFALLLGLVGAVLTTVAAMIIAAAGVWFGGGVDSLVQRLTEANMILPILAICVLFYALYGVSIWTILGIIVLLNVFGSPTKSFRAAFIQIKESPYVEAAQAYGASDWRIITHYMVPRIIPVLIPQLVALIPSYVFLEATLGIFNIKSLYPTWGRVIYNALRYGLVWGSRYWVLQPIALLLLTGFAFAMIGAALDRILNPRLRGV